MSLGIFKEDEVNFIVHGHEPLLAELIVELASDPEMIAYAKSKGAKGINLGGMCCTANEILVRHGSLQQVASQIRNWESCQASWTPSRWTCSASCLP